MKVSAHNGVNPAWSFPHPVQKRTSTAQRVRVNPEVENYRVISGIHERELEFLEHALDYSTSVPLKQRGISKVVLDKPHYLQARNYLSRGEPLSERLSKEGIEVILIEDIAEFLEKRYPKVLTTLDLLDKLYDCDAGSECRNFSKKVFSEICTDVLLFFLPEYAFSSGNNEHLKAVTVTRNHFFSFLFLPSETDNDTLSTGAFIEGIEERANEQIFYPSFIIDGSALRDVTTKSSRSTGQFFTPEYPRGFRLTVPPYHYLWINSQHLAKDLARIVNQTITRYLDQPLMVRMTEDQLKKNHENMPFFQKYSKKLAEVINDKDPGNTVTCYKPMQLDPRKNVTLHCWSNDQSGFGFYTDLRFNFISVLSKEYLLPGFKKAAQDCGIQYIEYPSYESSEIREQVAEKSNVLWLLQPPIVFFSNNASEMACFITRISPDVSESIRARYLMETAFRTSEPQSFCVPIITQSDVRQMAASADHMQELARINRDILDRYSPQAEPFCYNYSPSRNSNPPAPMLTPHCNDYTMFGIVGGCAVAPIRALAPGLFLGMIAGFTDHIHRDAITQHPVACSLACIASSAAGYCSLGLFGVGLNLGCWTWQSYWRREQIIESRFWGYKLFQSLSLSPLLISGIYHFAIGMAGFALGNYCTTAVARKVLKNHTGDGKKQRDLPTERQKKRRRPTRKPAALVASQMTGHREKREKDAASTEISTGDFHREDPVVLQRQMIRDMLSSSGELPWSLPDIELLVMAYVQDIEDRQERADYLEQRLAECEQAADGLLFAVARFPDLYGLYLQTHQGNDIRRAKGLWTVLTPTSSQELLVLAGKMLTQDFLNNDDPARALTTLNDSRLSEEVVMGIIDGLSGADILFRDEVPEKWARAYLARINLRERKQKTANHIRNAVTRWLQQRVKKPELTDNLLHLAMDFRLTDNSDEQTRILIHRFREALRDQAEIEGRYLPDIKNKVSRYLRAGAIEIALNEPQR